MTFDRLPERTKYSYGVACVRYNKNRNPPKIELLLIKKKCTYAFIDFITGHYKIQNKPHIQSLFNNMTVHEKTLIMNNDFSALWYYAFMSKPEALYYNNIPGVIITKENKRLLNDYIHKKEQYTKLRQLNKGKLFDRMIRNSTNIDCIWEIPKGKKEYEMETDLDCAMREFNEETGLDKRKYKFWFDIRTFNSTDIDNKIRWITTYYPAVLNSKYIYKYTFNLDNPLEACDARFFSLDEIKTLPQRQRHIILQVAEPLMKIAKKKIKSSSNIREENII